jgi:crotonobetainyl-CoA:carnitine CoA-transferase CaiB-like acyl-CoA transferase
MRTEGFTTGAFGDADWANMKFGEISREEMGALEEPVKAFFAAHTMAELFEGAMQRRILLAPLVTVKEVVESPQLRAMDYWQPIEDQARGGTLEYPTFLHASETTAVVRSPAPAIGGHAHPEVFNPERNVSGRSSSDAVPASPSENGDGALAGLKVVDLGRSIVGPVVSRFLTLHGATVVRVESRQAPDLKRLTGPFKDGQAREDFSVGSSSMHCNKYGVTIDLKHPQGKEMMKRLLAWADVVVENYTVGTMDGLGLGYEELRETNPGLIMVSISGRGAKGPHARQPGWAMFMAALTGISGLTGMPSSDPSFPMAPFPDELPPRFAVAGLLAALDHRRRTGKGQHLELSQLETCVYLLAPFCFDYTVNGRVAQRQGNRADWTAPHGVFRCKGDDRWSAIAVTSEEQWPRLCDVLGKTEWADDERFATLQARKKNEDQLEDLIEEWTSTRSPEEVMELLQKAGVPAGRVSNAKDLCNDPQLRFRQHLVTVDHPHMGRHSVEVPGFRLSATPAYVDRPGPGLGEHNELVFCQWLGVSGEDFVELMDQGAFY